MSFDLKYDRDGYPIATKQPFPAEPVEPIETPEIKIEATEDAQEVAPQEQESIEQQETQQVEAPVAPAPKESAQAKNFRELREAKEREEEQRRRAERERDELARRLKDMESNRDKSSQVREKAAEAEEEDYNFTINPDDLVEGKHLSKVDKKIKSLEKKLAEQEQKNAFFAIQNRLSTQYPDFDKVVSRENVEAFKAQYPELAQTLIASTDPYAVGVSAYTMIKKFGIAQDTSYQIDEARLQKNAAKPRPANTVAQSGDSPLAKANAFAQGLTPDLKKQLFREMEEAKKNY